MRKRIVELKIVDSIYPATGIAYHNQKMVKVKNALPGQTVKVKINRKRKDYLQANLLEVIQASPLEKTAPCPHYQLCGGCNLQTLAYQNQLELKEAQVKKLFKQAGLKNYNYLGILPSPAPFAYRNKMEFSFGDLEKNGQLQLGLHLRKRRFDIVSVENCLLVDRDFQKILSANLEYFRQLGLPKYHFKTKKGYLRHLVVRKGLQSGEILVNLVTSSQSQFNSEEYVAQLLSLDLEGKIVGILQSINDDLADAVKCDQLLIHYGSDYYYEKLLNLKFKIKPLAFFQPNTGGAEKIYQTVLNFLGSSKDKLIYDLYCGTGTISQLVASRARQVLGIELVEEAVAMARENARLNGLNNCHFLAGDVLEKLAELQEKPDTIILDPPRPGVHPQALEKIIAYQAKQIIYVSCNPKTLVRDLKLFTSQGYKIDKLQLVDMFPQTGHLESIVSIIKQ